MDWWVTAQKKIINDKNLKKKRLSEQNSLQQHLAHPAGSVAHCSPADDGNAGSRLDFFCAGCRRRLGSLPCLTRCFRWFHTLSPPWPALHVACQTLTFALSALEQTPEDVGNI